jgi:hypothetical protein
MRVRQQKQDINPRCEDQRSAAGHWAEHDTGMQTGSVVDPDPFDTDSDPAFHFDTDPDRYTPLLDFPCK